MTTDIVTLANDDDPQAVVPRPKEDSQEFGIALRLPFSTPYVPPRGVKKRSKDDLYEVFNEKAEDEPNILQLQAMRRTDGQARALYRLITLPIRSALRTAKFVPAKDGELEAEFAELMLTLPYSGGGMQTPMRTVIAQMLMAVFDGYSAFEQVLWRPKKGPLEGMWTLRKIAHRPAETVTFITDDHGEFEGIRQRTVIHGKEIDEFIDARSCIYFAVQEEERPFYGVSYFQAAFSHFDKKVKLYYISHLAAQHRAVGARIGTAPASASKAERDTFLKHMEDFGFAQAILLPKDFEIEHQYPTANASFLDLINHHNSQMSKSVLAAFFDDSQGGGADSALVDFGKQDDSMFVMMLQALMDDLAGLINDKLIPKFIDWNFGSEKYPEFKFGTFTNEQKEIIHSTFEKLAVAGQTLTVTHEFMRELEKYMAEELGLDNIDYEDIDARERADKEKADLQAQEMGQFYGGSGGFPPKPKAPDGPDGPQPSKPIGQGPSGSNSGGVRPPGSEPDTSVPFAATYTTGGNTVELTWDPTLHPRDPIGQFAPADGSNKEPVKESSTHIKKPLEPEHQASAEPKGGFAEPRPRDTASSDSSSSTSYDHTTEDKPPKMPPELEGRSLESLKNERRRLGREILQSSGNLKRVLMLAQQVVKINDGIEALEYQREQHRDRIHQLLQASSASKAALTQEADEVYSTEGKTDVVELATMWQERLHPRDNDGKFAEKPGTGVARAFKALDTSAEVYAKPGGRGTAHYKLFKDGSAQYVNARMESTDLKRDVALRRIAKQGFEKQAGDFKPARPRRPKADAPARGLSDKIKKPPDTPQQKAILRKSKTAQKVRREWPVGTRVTANTKEPTGREGTVTRHVPGTNAQGGHLNVKWDNGTEGRHSPVSLKKVTSEDRVLIGREWDRKSAREWTESKPLSPEQLKVVEDYTGGEGYKGTNRGLRGRAKMTPKIESEVAGLDSIMEPLPQDIVVRHFTHRREFPKNVQPGDQWSDPGFLSTTISGSTADRKHISNSLAGIKTEDILKGKEDQAVEVVLHVPAGVKGRYLEPWAPKKFGYEKELLLDRGLKWQVERAERMNGNGELSKVTLLGYPADQQPQRSLDSLNPSRHGVFEDYTTGRAFRASAPLASNMTTLAETRGKDPDETLTVYRGVPKSAPDGLQPGDYVTTMRQLASDYAGDGRVIAAKVRYGDILDDREDPGNESEFIYRPQPNRYWVKPVSADKVIKRSDFSNPDTPRTRAVSPEEFALLSDEGRAKLESFRQDSAPPEGLDKNFDALTDQAFKDTREPWGGMTIDARSGKPVDPGKEAYALSVKNGVASVTIPADSDEATFKKAMKEARERFDNDLRYKQISLGIFHDDDTGQIEFDPVLVVDNLHDVDTIGSYTHAVGGAYGFHDGNGYWPPYVEEKPGEQFQEARAAEKVQGLQGSGAVAPPSQEGSGQRAGSGGRDLGAVLRGARDKRAQKRVEAYHPKVKGFGDNAAVEDAMHKTAVVLGDTDLIDHLTIKGAPAKELVKEGGEGAVANHHQSSRAGENDVITFSNELFPAKDAPNLGMGSKDSSMVDDVVYSASVGFNEKAEKNLTQPQLTVAHEMGHEITLDVETEALRDNPRLFQDEVMVPLSKALGVDPPDVPEDGAGLRGAIEEWREKNAAVIAKKVSTYGSSMVPEMYAELWAKYVDDPDAPGPAKAFGDGIKRVHAQAKHADMQTAQNRFDMHVGDWPAPMSNDRSKKALEERTAMAMFWANSSEYNNNVTDPSFPKPLDREWTQKEIDDAHANNPGLDDVLNIDNVTFRNRIQQPLTVWWGQPAGTVDLRPGTNIVDAGYEAVTTDPSKLPEGYDKFKLLLAPGTPYLPDDPNVGSTPIHGLGRDTNWIVVGKEKDGTTLVEVSAPREWEHVDAGTVDFGPDSDPTDGGRLTPDAKTGAEAGYENTSGDGGDTTGGDPFADQPDQPLGGAGFGQMDDAEYERIKAKFARRNKAAQERLRKGKKNG